MKQKNRKETPEPGQEADVNAKRIFGNHTLCAQFLRDYAGLPMLSDVQPEDIEDVTQRYHLFREVEFQTDTVKKVRLRKRGKELEVPEASDIYILSLIEHKSSVDYDITMQILKYMICIWENESAKRAGRKKDYRYPPIYPIVYYEGSGEWTAARNLKDRILLGDLFEAYIPDFTYQLVWTQDYSKEELLSREDAISLLMLINKIQQAKDFEEVSGLPVKKLNGILKRAPMDVTEIIVSALRSLCRRLNLTEEETTDLMKEVEGGNMGYLWENMEKMDIQLERRNTAEARQKLEEAKREAADAKQKADRAEQEAADAKQKADQAEQEKMKLYRLLTGFAQKQGLNREALRNLLEKEAGLSRNAADDLLATYGQS